jgi:hypothetical protein
MLWTGWGIIVGESKFKILLASGVIKYHVVYIAGV